MKCPAWPSTHARGIARGLANSWQRPYHRVGGAFFIQPAIPVLVYIIQHFPVSPLGQVQEPAVAKIIQLLFVGIPLADIDFNVGKADSGTRAGTLADCSANQAAWAFVAVQQGNATGRQPSCWK